MGLRSYLKAKKDEGVFHVNRGMIPIELAYSTFNLGMGMIFPYLTLQARNIGLTYSDISLIYGIIPFFTFISTPITGFIGDRIGYKFLLIVNIVLLAVSQTLFDFTPRYSKETRAPTAVVYHHPSSPSSSPVVNVASVQWPLCDVPTTDATCTDSKPFASGFSGIETKISCEDVGLVGDDYIFVDAFVVEVDNGTFCYSENAALDVSDGGYFQNCRVEGYPDMETCTTESGSHTVTFWIYFLIRLVFNWTMNSTYALMDGTTVRMADEHNSDYSKVMFWATFAATISPFIAGAVIEDPEEGSNEEVYYQLSYYICDGFLGLTCLIVLWLNVTMERSGDKVWKALRRLMTPTALNFFAFVFILGFQWGIRDSYLAVYLQEDLGADSALISYTTAISSGSVMLMALVNRPIVKAIKPINILVASIWIECAREVIYSYVDQSPPWYSLVLYAFDSIYWGLGWLACVYYGNKITHPDLAGTMVATVGSIEFIIAKGLASLVGGQIIDNTEWETPELFRAVAIATLAGSIIFIIPYYLFIWRKHEKRQMEAREEVLSRIKARKEEEEKKTGHVNEALDHDSDTTIKDDETTKPKRPAMKKVDSVMEAASLGHMAAHSNIYPLRNRHEDEDATDNADPGVAVIESGMRTLDAVMRSYSGGNWEEHDHPDTPHPATTGNRPFFEIGMPKHDSIEEEEEEEEEVEEQERSNKH